MMPAQPFNRDDMANWYAQQHLRTDPGITQIHYLTAAPEREIRFIEVNKLLGEMGGDTLEPLDFGVDAGSRLEHKLLILDVTPSQWEAIQSQRLRLPAGWDLEGSRSL